MDRTSACNAILKCQCKFEPFDFIMRDAAQQYAVIFAKAAQADTRKRARPDFMVSRSVVAYSLRVHSTGSANVPELLMTPCCASLIESR